MKYIIVNKMLYDGGLQRCYLGDAVNQNWTSLEAKENAKIFESREAAEDYIKRHKLKYHVVEEIE